MFWLILFLLFVGIGLILMESLTPHGVSALLGLASIAFAGWLVFKNYGSVEGMAFLVIALIVAGALALLTARLGSRAMMLKPVRPDESRRSDGTRKDSPPVGERVRVAQPLHPTGAVEWRGRRIAARIVQLEREAPEGETVVVCGQDAIYLLVELPENAASGPLPPKS